jgi:hypothetical protein
MIWRASAPENMDVRLQNPMTPTVLRPLRILSVLSALAKATADQNIALTRRSFSVGGCVKSFFFFCDPV